MNQIMKRLILIFALLCGICHGALSSTAVWEIANGGSAANSGYFNPANANFVTDFTATSATGNAPVFSSATYNFVAGDVGAWIYVQSGTNWLPGWYKISSVAANAATVDATIGHGVTLTASVWALSTVAGVASTASPTGGVCGVDYSQQAAAKLSLTDLASVGASTSITSVTAGFTPVMVGNGLHLTTTGTGAFGIIGWYELVSYTNATTMVTDQTTNNGTALAAGTCAIGGSILTMGAIGSATTRLGAVAGNTIWLKGALSNTAAEAMACSGSATSPIKFVGYGTYRTDGYLGRTAAGVLTTTNMPTVTYSASGRINGTGTFLLYETINFVSSASNFAVLLGADSAVARCFITNSSTNASAGGLDTGSRCVIYNSDIALTGASGGTAAIRCGSDRERVVACRIRAVSSTAPGIIVTFGSPLVALNTIFANGGNAITQSSNGTAGNVLLNTIAGAGGDGINVVTGSTGLQFLMDNMFTDGAAYGMNLVSAGNAAFVASNRTRDNASGAINLGTNWVAATNYNAITTDTGGPETDYVSAGSTNFNYNLIAASPATSAAIPASASMGALQRSQTSSSAVEPASSYVK